VSVTASEMTSAEYAQWVKGLYDSKRHGAGDQLGSLNYIDAAARLRGRDAIQTGESIGLATQLQGGPSVRGEDANAFAMEVFSRSEAAGFSLGEGFGIQSDRIELDCHGPVNTHIDALNHVGFFGVWFDGTPLSETATGGSLINLSRFGIFTRAVHADIGAVRGMGYAGPDREVTGEEIDAALARTGAEFQPGDAILIDCGREKYEAVYGQWAETTPRAGSGPSVAAWLAQHNPSLVLWDMLDGDNTQQIVGPIHQLNWAIGLILIDNCNFAPARARLAQSPVGSCAVSVAPLPIEGATGNNVNPMLIF
jgi:kynurenine formamidase